MSWYASQIITSGYADVVKTLQAIPALKNRLFLLDEPIRKSWKTPEETYDVPADGLLFLRSICDPTSPISEWFAEDEIISTKAFAELEGADLTIDPRNLSQYELKEEPPIVPYLDALRFAKRLSQMTSSAVAYYYCYFWGGHPEIEFAWVFDDAERAFIRLVDPRPGANRLLAIGPDGAEDLYEDVLVKTMAALGCDLPGPYFYPHTRSYAWDEHRL